MTLWPTGDITTEWGVFPAGLPHYDNIDYDTDSDYITAGQNDDADIDEFSFPSIPNVLTVTSIEVSIQTFNSSGGVIDCYIDVYLGGYLGQKFYDVSPSPAQTVTQTWSSLSGSQADLDGLQVRVIADATINKNQWIRIYLLKVIVTYDELVTSRGAVWRGRGRIGGYGLSDY